MAELYNETEQQLKNFVKFSISLPHNTAQYLKKHVDNSKRSQFITRLIEESRDNHLNKPATELLKDIDTEIQQAVNQQKEAYKQQQIKEAQKQFSIYKQKIDTDISQAITDQLKEYEDTENSKQYNHIRERKRELDTELKERYTKEIEAYKQQQTIDLEQQQKEYKTQIDTKREQELIDYKKQTDIENQEYLANNKAHIKLKSYNQTIKEKEEALERIATKLNDREQTIRHRETSYSNLKYVAILIIIPLLVIGIITGIVAISPYALATGSGIVKYIGSGLSRLPNSISKSFNSVKLPSI